MTVLQKILLVWGGAIILICAGAIAYPQMGGSSISDFALPASSSLLGVVAYYINISEASRGSKLAFLNFALFFGVNGLARPFYQLAKRWFLMSNIWSDLYYFEYDWALNLLWLSFSVVYLVLGHKKIGHSEVAGYFATLALVVGVWVMIFFPLIIDATYVYNTQDIRNFSVIRKTIEGLRQSGNTNPSTIEIASCIQSNLSGGSEWEGSLLEDEGYIAELQKYIPGDNFRLLLFKPFFARCSLMSLFSVLLIIIYLVYQYWVDSPRGVYVEKLVWCLLPFCLLDALHTFAFTSVAEIQVYENIEDLGRYLSTAVMWIILLLFGLRLRFVQSIEGQYYERHIESDPSRITRWRDAFDNWILRQFMNPKELDRRFMTRKQSHD